MNKQDYWDSIVEDGPYQMGYRSHRVYLLDLLANDKNQTIRSILDVGCGTGPIYGLLKLDKSKPDSKWNVIEKYKGVDPSQGMIDTARKEFPEAQWEVQDARGLGEEDNSWDCVLLMHSLDYIPEYRLAIFEAARVARKYVCIVLWRTIDYMENAENVINTTIDGDQEHDWNLAHLQQFSWDKLTEAFKDANLRLVKKEDGKIVNEEGTTNTVILLEKI